MAPSPLEQHITWPLSRIVGYACSLRNNGPGADWRSRAVAASVDHVCAWIREFGFKVACRIRSDRELMDGHPPLKAARWLGRRDTTRRISASSSSTQ